MSDEEEYVYTPPTEEQKAKFREAFLGKNRTRLDDAYYAAHPNFSTRLECPGCKSTDLTQISCLAWGPHPQYECNACGRYYGYYEFLMKNTFVVTPLPENTEKK